MKKNLLLILFACCAALAVAQTQHKYKYVGASFQPQYAYRFSNSKSVKKTDSLTTSEKNRAGYSIFLQYHQELGKYLVLQTGIQYTNVGFTKVVSNLTNKTRLHPDLPLLDATFITAPEPTAELNYVFDYIDIPVLLNRRVYFFTKPTKHWEFFVTYGASLNFMFQDRVAVRLKGFTIDNKRAFNVNNTYLKDNFFNLTGHLGFRATYNHSNKLSFITQPMFNLPALNATKGDLKYRFVSFGLQVGFAFNLDIKGEEEVIE